MSEVRPGITAVVDEVIVDKQESYTSQIGACFLKALMKFQEAYPKTAAEIQTIAQKVIIDTIEDLRKRRYPIA